MQAIVTPARSKRFERRPSPAPFQLTERDLAILTHVARHRFLSSQHLAALDGGSEQNLLRCLRVLFDHGFLDRPHAQLAHVPVTGPRPIIYGLGRRGAQSLRDHAGYAPEQSDWTERNKRAGAKFIEHTVAIADVMVSLEVACRDRKDVSLLLEGALLAEAPQRVRQSREPLRLVVPGLDNRLGISSVIPDGLFGLSFDDGTEAYFALEVDRGSMPVTRSRFDRTSFLRKLTVYWEAWKRGRHVEHYGLKQLRVLTVTDTRKRVENMLGVVNELTGGKGSNFFLFTTFGDLSTRSPLEAELITGRGERCTLMD